jgi:hypothetical protein
MAPQKPDGTALWVAGPLVVFARLTRPLIFLMNGIGNAILKVCGFHSATAIAVDEAAARACFGTVDGDYAEVFRPDCLNARSEFAVRLLQDEGLLERWALIADLLSSPREWYVASEWRNWRRN